MEKRNLYIIVAAVLVVGLVLSFTGLTGRSMTVIGKCSDSDGGNKPGAPGSVSYVGGPTSKDECYAEGGLGPVKFLRERFCLERMETKLYKCEGSGNTCLQNSKGEGYCKGEANPFED